jgi:hypothetical protein
LRVDNLVRTILFWDQVVGRPHPDCYRPVCPQTVETVRYGDFTFSIAIGALCHISNGFLRTEFEQHFVKAFNIFK